MERPPKTPLAWKIILPIILLNLILHLYGNTLYGFHRDELLYYSLGHRPDWGFWSVPPFIGSLSWLIQTTIGDGIFGFRLVSSLTGCGLMLLVAMICRELGGKSWAQAIGILGIFMSPVYMRTSVFFMPVIYDVFFWTLSYYWLIRYMNERQNWQLYAITITLAVGFLNKYLIVFLLIAFLIGFLLSSYRELYKNKHLWLAAGLALVLILPNVLWQVKYDFPVLTHMRLLKTYHLDNVEPTGFILEQFLFTLMASLLWIPALFWLFIKRKKQRILVYTFIVVICLLLAFQGKGYYSAGLYPLMIAAGAVFWETEVKWKPIRYLLPLFIVLPTLGMLPFGMPILGPEKMINYGKWTSKNLHLQMLLRWENGEIYDLPQDYADMLGWEELGQIILDAWRQAPDPEQTILYCENYGQAGAAMRFAVPEGVTEPISFNGTFAIWAPIETHANALIYVNNELGEDIQQIFSDIQLIGKIEHPYARERGTQVYLCQKPVQPFSNLWDRRIQEVKANLGIQLE